jgi:hypothetical protein
MSGAVREADIAGGRRWDAYLEVFSGLCAGGAGAKVPFEFPILKSSAMKKIGLALSGGGFWASLYHLGLVRFLRDAGILPHVSHITSVSGGSILAAHLVLNWDRYNGSPTDFDAAAAELLAFVRLDIRNRIIRRFPLALSLRWPRRLRLKVVKTPENAGNHPFRLLLLLTSPTAQVQFPPQEVPGKACIAPVGSSAPGQKEYCWEASWNFEKVPVGDYVDLIVEEMAPDMFLRRGEVSTTFSFEIKAKSAEVTRWLLLRRDHEDRNFTLMRYKTGMPDKVEPVKIVTRIPGRGLLDPGLQAAVGGRRLHVRGQLVLQVERRPSRLVQKEHRRVRPVATPDSAGRSSSEKATNDSSAASRCTALAPAQPLATSAPASSRSPSFLASA